MNITIVTIPHDEQRYNTCGDWTISENEIIIKVSRLGNWRYELLVGVHELCETLLCLDRGITGEVVDKFDMEYERRRSNNEGGLCEEPGDDSHAPYRREHFFATNVERLLAAELGVDWFNYEKAIDSL